MNSRTQIETHIEILPPSGPRPSSVSTAPVLNDEPLRFSTEAVLSKIASHYPSSQAAIAASLEQMANDWYVEFARAGVEWQLLPELYTQARRRMTEQGRTAFAPSIDDILQQWQAVVNERERSAQQARQESAFAAYEAGGYSAPPNRDGLEFFLAVGRELGWKGTVAR